MTLVAPLAFDTGLEIEADCATSFLVKIGTNYFIIAQMEITIFNKDFPRITFTLDHHFANHLKV